MLIFEYYNQFSVKGIAHSSGNTYISDVNKSDVLFPKETIDNFIEKDDFMSFKKIFESTVNGLFGETIRLRGYLVQKRSFLIVRNDLFFRNKELNNEEIHSLYRSSSEGESLDPFDMYEIYQYHLKLYSADPDKGFLDKIFSSKLEVDNTL